VPHLRPLLCVYPIWGLFMHTQSAAHAYVTDTIPFHCYAARIFESHGLFLTPCVGGGRLLKSSLCLHDEGGLVAVKSYFKRPEVGSGDVQRYEDALIRIRTALSPIPCPHVWPTQRLYHSDRAIHLVRQYLWSSLAQRITSRPFLTTAEKRWLGYQLLEAVAQAHEAGVCHGDIKSENVMLTSWGWLFLVDFAPYKPTFLPADNPVSRCFCS